MEIIVELQNNTRSRYKKIRTGAALVLALLTFVIGMIVGWRVLIPAEMNQKENRISGYRDDITSLNGNIEGLNDKIAAMNAEKENLLAEMAALRGEIEERDAKIAELEEELVGIFNNGVIIDPNAEKEPSDSVHDDMMTVVKWLVWALILIVLIVSGMFYLINVQSPAQSGESESEDVEAQGNETHDDEDGEYGEDGGDEYENVDVAISCMRRGELEENIDILGGFFFGITNLIALLDGSDESAVFGRDEEGDFAAFYVNGDSELRVIPRSMYCEGDAVTHRHFGDLFAIKFDGEAPSGDFGIAELISPAEFLVNEDGSFTLLHRGEVAAAEAVEY